MPSTGEKSRSHRLTQVIVSGRIQIIVIRGIIVVFSAPTRVFLVLEAESIIDCDQKRKPDFNTSCTAFRGEKQASLKINAKGQDNSSCKNDAKQGSTAQGIVVYPLLFLVNLILSIWQLLEGNLAVLARAPRSRQ